MFLLCNNFAGCFKGENEGGERHSIDSAGALIEQLAFSLDYIELW